MTSVVPVVSCALAAAGTTRRVATTKPRMCMPDRTPDAAERIQPMRALREIVKLLHLGCVDTAGSAGSFWTLADAQTAAATRSDGVSHCRRGSVGPYARTSRSVSRHRFDRRRDLRVVRRARFD